MKPTWYETHIIFKRFFLLCYLNKMPQAAYFWRSWNAFFRALNAGKSNTESEVPRWVLYAISPTMKGGVPKLTHRTMGWQGRRLELTKHSVKICLQRHWCLNEANQMVSWSSHWHNYLLILILFGLVCRISIL